MKYLQELLLFAAGVAFGMFAWSEFAPEYVKEVQVLSECTMGDIDNQILSNYAAMKCEAMGMNIEPEIVYVAPECPVCDCTPDYDDGFDAGYSRGVSDGEQQAEMYQIEEKKCVGIECTHKTYLNSRRR